MEIKSTKDVVLQGIKICVYGEAGVGKTRLSSTAPDPIILSAEDGLLSLKELDLPFIEINKLGDLIQAYRWIKKSAEAKNYQTICVDSISDIAEAILWEYKQGTKDPRQAYGGMADDMMEALRKFRSIKGMHVYFTAKLHRLEEGGVTKYVPAAPGQVLFQGLPFLFDELFVYRYSGDIETGQKWLQTRGSIKYTAKDRSGQLDEKEKPDLTYVFNKITKGGKHGSITENSNDRGK